MEEAVNTKSRLPSAFSRFLIVQALFTVAITICNIFINTFILRVTGDSTGVMFYNIVLGGVQPFAMVAACYVTKRFSAECSQRIGLGFYAAMYLLMAVLAENSIPYILYIGAIGAVAAGFYYTAYAVQIVEYLTDETRDRAHGAMGIVTGMISLGLPPLSAVVISAFGGFNGYRVLFVLGFAISAAAIGFTFRLPTSTNNHKDEYLRVFRAVLAGRAERAAMFSSLLSGIYAGLLSFFLNILLFSLVSSEYLVGLNSSLGGVCSILGSFVYMRTIRPARRVRSMYSSVAVLVLAASVLFFCLSAATVIGFSLLYSLLSVFIGNPCTTAYIHVVERSPLLRSCSSEVHAVREIYYGIGRVGGILLTLVLPQTNGGSVLAIVAVLVCQFFSAHLVSVMGNIRE